MVTRVFDVYKLAISLIGYHTVWEQRLPTLEFAGLLAYFCKSKSSVGNLAVLVAKIGGTASSSYFSFSDLNNTWFGSELYNSWTEIKFWHLVMDWFKSNY